MKRAAEFFTYIHVSFRTKHTHMKNSVRARKIISLTSETLPVASSLAAMKATGEQERETDRECQSCPI